ncbi:alpha/beta hydrolase, partial [Mesorhizobium sp. M8A.F.Ca.ET.167.01.1.1]|uniref:alpha/beta hydrolase fold domain-containing protein n=1 Tax=Mesorhizobium sp. M8A.F.Ca.ET.167.01.1.1 TaxID=2563961 RepID=UPI001FDF456E
SHMAATVTRAGAIAVIVDYALMPAVRMAAIVDQVRRAQQWVLACIAQYGGDPERLTVSGHSAGAHLATMVLGDGLPVHMFIHGGYWRMFSKRDYSYIAETVTRAGAIAVIVDYALMPAVRM